MLIAKLVSTSQAKTRVSGAAQQASENLVGHASRRRSRRNVEEGRDFAELMAARFISQRVSSQK